MVRVRARDVQWTPGDESAHIQLFYCPKVLKQKSSYNRLVSSSKFQFVWLTCCGLPTDCLKTMRNSGKNSTKSCGWVPAGPWAYGLGKGAWVSASLFINKLHNWPVTELYRGPSLTVLPRECPSRQVPSLWLLWPDGCQQARQVNDVIVWPGDTHKSAGVLTSKHIFSDNNCWWEWDRSILLGRPFKGIILRDNY